MLATILGALFDTSQVFVSLADEATNVMVAIEFFKGERRVFFGLVVSVIVISSIISAVAFSIRIQKKLKDCCWRPETPCGWVLVVALLTPFGVLLPATNFILTKLYPEMDKNFGLSSVDWEIDGLSEEKREKKAQYARKQREKSEETINKLIELHAINDDDSTLTKASKIRTLENLQQQLREISLREANTVGEATGGAASELFDDEVKVDIIGLKLLDNAIVSRFGSFFLLNVQALSSSSIQAIIQLVAASLAADGAPTVLSTASLCLSLASVALKSYQLARSGTISALFWKVGIMSFDLFSTVFIFSVFLSRFLPDSDKNVKLFGVEDGANVVKLSAAYIYVKCVCAGLDLIAALIGAVMVIRKSDFDRCLLAVGMVLGFLVLAGPVLLAQDVVKLSYLLLLHQRNAPGPSQLPRVTMLHAFLWGAPGESFWRCCRDAYRPEVVDWQATFEKLRSHLSSLYDKQYDMVAAEQQRRERLDAERDNSKQQQEGGDDDDDEGDSVAAAAVNPRRTNHLHLLFSPNFASPSSSGGGKKEVDTPLSEEFLRSLPRSLTLQQSFVVGLRRFQQPNSLDSATEFETLDDAVSRARFLLLVSSFDRIWLQNRPGTSLVHLTTTFNMQQILQMIKRRRYDLAAGFDEIRRAGCCDPHEYRRKNLSVTDFSSVSQVAQRMNPLMHSSSHSSGSNNNLCSFCRELCNELCHHCNPEIFIGLLCAISCAVSTIFGILFPLIATALYFTYFTALQKICCILSLSALGLIVIMSPAMWRYQQTCALLDGDTGRAAGKDFPSVVDLFASLPISLVGSAIFAEQRERGGEEANSAFLLPEDALQNHVLPFLDARHVGLFGLAKAEFRELNASLRKLRGGGKNEAPAAAAVAVAVGHSCGAISPDVGGVPSAGEGDTQPLLNSEAHDHVV